MSSAAGDIPGSFRDRPWVFAWLVAGILLVLTAPPATAQDTTAVRLDIELIGERRDPRVITRNLLEETPWLSALRQGLPIRLQYRLEIWRSRETWVDELVRQIEWTIVIRHEPLLDQFSVVALRPNNSVSSRTYGTPGALAAALGVPYQLPVGPKTAGGYYYNATLVVATLSESDLDQFERVLKGELTPDAENERLAQRLRRLILRLAGLPTQSLSARSERFAVEP